MSIQQNPDRNLAVNELAQVLMEYGQRQTNPVLDAIPENGLFQVNKKYPKERLRFGNDQWRAYYHTHDDGHSDPIEHGHFHIFFRIDSTGEIRKDWTHVVGLSMDRDGQPIKWFTVNNWVTGDTWLAANVLATSLYFVFREQSLVARWLGALLACYQETIGELLVSRDQLLENHRCDRTLEDALLEREIYYLSSYQINLLQDLEVVLD